MIYPTILFHPNIPKPLHSLAPRVVLGELWWNDTKRGAKEKFDHHCWACGVHKSQAKYHRWLEAHECYSMNHSTGLVEYVGTVALCHACHNYIHDGRMMILTQRKEFPLGKYKAVLDHGNRLLEDLVKSQGVQWRGGKEAFQEIYLLDRYPKFQTFDKRLHWTGDGAGWGDYRLKLNGEIYAAPFKSPQEWQRFYSCHKRFVKS